MISKIPTGDQPKRTDGRQCARLGAAQRVLATAVADAAARRGLLILKAGINGNCIRVLVPLVIGDAELDEALGAWEEALEEASA